MSEAISQPDPAAEPQKRGWFRRYKEWRASRSVRRVWVLNVDVSAKILEARLDALKARRDVLREQVLGRRAAPMHRKLLPKKSTAGAAGASGHDQSPTEGRMSRRMIALEDKLNAEEAIDRKVRCLLESARLAAHRKHPVPNRVMNWWGGRLIEAAYQNLHAAEALMAALYGWDEIEAELPEAVARVEAGLQRDDPRREAAQRLATVDRQTVPLECARASLGKAIEVGHAVGDREHSRIRGFRNAILASAVALALFVILFAGYVYNNPDEVPLCFTPATVEPAASTQSGGESAAGSSTTGSTTGNEQTGSADVTSGEADAVVGDATLVCPTDEHTWDASNPTTAGPTDPHDIIVILLLGVLGGALSAAIAIKGLTGTSTPYDVPLALALLKLPMGALTSLGAIIFLQGDFVPGLSELDSQGQILAYALVFGYAQQLLSGLLDRKAQTLLDSAPGKEKDVQYTSNLVTPPSPRTAPRRGRAERMIDKIRGSLPA
jgi:hypothetical protein